MTNIDPKLLSRLRNKLHLTRSGAYARIEREAIGQALPRHLAALNVARDAGININRFASQDDLAALRGVAKAPAAALNDGAPAGAFGKPRPASKPKRGQKPRKRKGNSVFVVHGRNERLRKALFQFLRAAGVQPIEWSKAIALTGKPSPYVGEILETVFSKAQAVVVLLTPDDEAKLKSEFLRPGDPPFERRLTGQARPNVLFESGMAFGTHPNQTVLVEIGKLRNFSDTVGRHVVHLTNATERRQELMIKLRNAGCEVDFMSSAWQTEGDFTL